MVKEGGAWVATTATVTGDVVLGEGANLWYGASVRGDEAALTIGRRTNLQDNVVMHADPDEPQVLGDDCTIGHGALLHGMRVGNRCLIGMGAVLLQRSVVGDECLVGAGTLVREGQVIPARSVVLGVPGKVVRRVTDEEVARFLRSAEGYVAKAVAHADGTFARPV